jgi:DNA-binding transcriptional regulator YdaS (Cro superfamily)
VEAADRAGKVVRISVAQRRQRTRATRDDLLRNALRPNEVICIEYVRTSIHKGVIFRVVKIHRRKEK